MWAGGGVSWASTVYFMAQPEAWDQKGLPAIIAKRGRLAKNSEQLGARRQRQQHTGETEGGPHGLFLKSPALPEAEGMPQPGEREMSCLCYEQTMQRPQWASRHNVTAFFE